MFCHSLNHMPTRYSCTQKVRFGGTGLSHQKTKNSLNHLAVLRGKTIVSIECLADPSLVCRRCLELNAAAVAVDAPCGWSSGGRSREAERAMSRHGIRAYSVPAKTLVRLDGCCMGKPRTLHCSPISPCGRHLRALPNRRSVSKRSLMQSRALFLVALCVVRTNPLTGVRR